MVWVTLAGCALVSALVVTAGALWLADAASDGMHIVINGEHWTPEALDAGHWLAATLALAGALMAVMLVLSVVVPLALLLAGLAVALGVGAAALSMLVVGAVFLAPLGIVLLLGWLLLRPRRTAPAGAGSTQSPTAS
jgi:hypothetical protein